jgi:hypothetical protein
VADDLLNGDAFEAEMWEGEGGRMFTEDALESSEGFIADELNEDVIGEGRAKVKGHRQLVRRGQVVVRNKDLPID